MLRLRLRLRAAGSGQRAVGCGLRLRPHRQLDQHGSALVERVARGEHEHAVAVEQVQRQRAVVLVLRRGRRHRRWQRILHRPDAKGATHEERCKAGGRALGLEERLGRAHQLDGPTVRQQQLRYHALERRRSRTTANELERPVGMRHWQRTQGGGRRSDRVGVAGGLQPHALQRAGSRQQRQRQQPQARQRQQRQRQTKTRHPCHLGARGLRRDR
eukprot:scaffold43948_cov67-Phaeocystis_antarctica.AAC.5